MSTKPAAAPPGYHTITPSLTVQGASEAIEFYKQAFDAVECFRVMDTSGKVGHAEIKIGDSVVMICDEFPEWGSLGPVSVGGSPCLLRIYVADADKVMQQALDAGATEASPLANQFWGDRTGTVVDPFGHRWSIATHVEDVSPDEILRRAAAFMSGK